MLYLCTTFLTDIRYIPVHILTLDFEINKMVSPSSSARNVTGQETVHF